MVLQGGGFMCVLVQMGKVLKGNAISFVGWTRSLETARKNRVGGEGGIGVKYYLAILI